MGSSIPMVGNLPIHDSMKDTTPRGKRTQSYRRNPFQNPPRYPTRKGYWMRFLIYILLSYILYMMLYDFIMFSYVNKINEEERCTFLISENVC